MIKWSKILFLAVPGLGQFYLGQHAIGTLLALTWFSLMSAIVFFEEYGTGLALPLGVVWGISVFDVYCSKPRKPAVSPLFVHYLSQNVREELTEQFEKYDIPRRGVKVYCIGNAKVPGDSFGPIVGTALERRGHEIAVVGNEEQPLDASNLHQYYTDLDRSFVIAVDAGIAERPEQEGMFYVREGGLSPREGLGESLPVIGDLSIIFYACHNKTTGDPLEMFKDPSMRERSAYAAQLAAQSLDKVLRSLRQ